MEFKPDNFDKEFNLNNNKKKNNSPRGKMPSWLMIMAGAATIGGVVAARQPMIRTDLAARSAVNAPTAQSVSADVASYSALSDEKADSAELAARFNAQDDILEIESAANYTLPTMTPLSEESGVLLPSSGSSVKPTAQTEDETVQETEEDAVNENADESVQADAGSTVQENTEETVQVTEEAAEPESAAETAPLREETAGPQNAGEIPQEAEETAEPELPEGSVIAWADDKAYAVSVRPRENTPETAAEDPAKPEPQTSVFSVNGRQYEMQLNELDQERIPENVPAEPVIWLDETPLTVSLSADAKPDKPRQLTEEGLPAADESETASVEIQLNPLPADQTEALQRERFGDEFFPTATPVPTEVPTEIPTEEPSDDNWFVSMFNNIFGSSPTQTPTPQVTVIVLSSPTPTAVLPTATPIVVRMQPVMSVQEPVRLDQTEQTAGSESASKPDVSAGDDLNDPALQEEEDDNVVRRPAPTRAPTQPAPSRPDGSPERIEPVIVESSDREAEPTPTPGELPHTGGVEGWNIPSMLGMLIGLLLVILGVRRLRTKE